MKLPTLGNGAVPELGAPRADIHLGCSRETFHAIFGWGTQAGEGGEDDRESHFTGLHACLVLAALVFSFPFIN